MNVMTTLIDRQRQIVEQLRGAGALDAEFGLLDYKQFDGEVSNVIRSSARHGFAYRLGSQSHR